MGGGPTDDDADGISHDKNQTKKISRPTAYATEDDDEDDDVLPLIARQTNSSYPELSTDQKPRYKVR